MRHGDLSLACNSCLFLHSQSSLPYFTTLLLTCGNAKSSGSKQLTSRRVSGPTSKVLADRWIVCHVDQLRAGFGGWAGRKCDTSKTLDFLTAQPGHKARSEPFEALPFAQLSDVRAPIG